MPYTFQAQYKTSFVLQYREKEINQLLFTIMLIIFTWIQLKYPKYIFLHLLIGFYRLTNVFYLKLERIEVPFNFSDIE